MIVEVLEDWLLSAPPSTPNFSGKVGLNLAFGLVTSC